MPTPGGISLFMQPLPEKTENSEDEGDPEEVDVEEPVTVLSEVVEKNTSSDEQLVSRLVTRIAELEEKLYQKELDQPVRPGGCHQWGFVWRND